MISVSKLKKKLTKQLMRQNFYKKNIQTRAIGPKSISSILKKKIAIQKIIAIFKSLKTKTRS
jgi:hypothetical protein